MAELHINDEIEWSFPILNLESDMSEASLVNENMDEELSEQSTDDEEDDESDIVSEYENLTKEKPVSKRASQSAKLKEIEEKENQVEALRLEYEKKLSMVNDLLRKMEHPFRDFDNELIEVTKTIITKITKKLIHKELTVEPLLITEMVNELIVLVQEKNSLLTVSVSEVDYNRLKTEDYQSSVLFVIDNSLSEGDIIVRSNVTEIRALINDGIDKILGEKHDE